MSSELNVVIRKFVVGINVVGIDGLSQRKI